MKRHIFGGVGRYEADGTYWIYKPVAGGRLVKPVRRARPRRSKAVQHMATRIGRTPNRMLGPGRWTTQLFIRVPLENRQ